MSKKLWCVKQGGRVVGSSFEKKIDAKEERNTLEGELPENPDNANAWKYCVSRGPDHWRTHAK